MPMNWDDLRSFLAVARHGSHSAAARVLGVTQPTIGRRMAAFERELGAQLFVATRLGQELWPNARVWGAISGFAARFRLPRRNGWWAGYWHPSWHRSRRGTKSWSSS